MKPTTAGIGRAERRRLETAAADYPYLRGLFGVVLGPVFLLAALGNVGWGPLGHAWVFVACLAVLGAAALLVDRYYDAAYGTVTLSTRRQTRAAVAMVALVPVIFGGSLLARSTADWSLDLPVNPIAATFALGMLVYYAVTIGLRAHHVVILGGLFVAGALPVWHGGDPGNVGLVMAGVAVMATGLLDHRMLVRNIRPGAGAGGDAPA